MILAHVLQMNGLNSLATSNVHLTYVGRVVGFTQFTSFAGDCVHAYELVPHPMGVGHSDLKEKKKNTKVGPFRNAPIPRIIRSGPFTLTSPV